MGEFDYDGFGPADSELADPSKAGNHYAPAPRAYHRELASAGAEPVRLGNRCHHYEANNRLYNDPYDWKFCKNMTVGETYEIHWPHSAAGACGTKWQMQTPFYDGVFCKDAIITIAPLNTYQKIGVQSQVFTIVNSEDPHYKYDNLIEGAWNNKDLGGDKWADVAMYTGSTTGTLRDDYVCSRYTPITWQVDRKCHVIAASSFDRLCEDMLKQEDNMDGDVYAHGARIHASPALTANNQQSRE